jgi:putative phosphoesterase
MRIGIVSDIHGNARALERALLAMGTIDELWCLGDCINEFRFSNEVVALLRERATCAIRGNHEEVFYGPTGERARTARWIEPDLLEWLGRRPSRLELSRAGRQVLIVHSTPWPPGGDYVCAHDRSFRRFADVPADIVLYGHTHRAVVQRAGEVLVVNPGSTGEPRLVEDRWVCSCAVVEPARDRATIVEFEA